MIHKIEWKTCIRIGITLLALYLCVYYWDNVSGLLAGVLSALVPLLIGFVIAYPLNILMSFYERHYFPKSKKKLVAKTRRGVSLVLAIITLVAIVALIVWLVLPQLVECIKLVVAELPGVIDELIIFLDSTGIFSEDVITSLSEVNWQDTIGDIVSVVSSGMGSVMDVVVSMVSSVATGVTSALLGIIFAIYVLASKETLGAQFKRLMKHYLPEKVNSKITYVLSVADDSFHNFIVGQCTEAVILGLLCVIGMLILQLPYSGMVGALTAFTSLIPVVGPFIGGGIGAFIIFTQSPVKALIFLIFIVILQQVEGNLIYPRVVGSSVGLPGIWVLAAVTVGGGVMGITGVLLGVPLASVAYRLVKDDLARPDKRLEEKAVK